MAVELVTDEFDGSWNRLIPWIIKGSWTKYATGYRPIKFPKNVDPLRQVDTTKILR